MEKADLCEEAYVIHLFIDLKFMALKMMYRCGECGEQSSRWLGKCPSCSAWNTLVEEAVDTRKASRTLHTHVKTSCILTPSESSARMTTGIMEFDRVLGGGMMRDALMLLTGDPGIGKSTLALQVGLALARAGKSVLYVSGEESVSQISERARRLDSKAEELKSFELLSETRIETVVATMENAKADLVIADSVQTFLSESVSSLSGSVSQTRFVAEKFMEYCKRKSVPCLLIGHVTKDGSLAGPKTLEHLVDTVLYFEGDRYHDLRLLRSQKNRFGSTLEVGVFKMQGDGLTEVLNPSADFLEGRNEDSTGSAISVSLEGTRPFLLEVQALASPSDLPYPRRNASGLELSRVQLLTAVVSKHTSLSLDQMDVYANITGGFRVRDPALDLAFVAALLSSASGAALPHDVAIIGEVGLSGEIRSVGREEIRIREAEKLGFRQIWGNLRSADRGKFRILKHIRELSADFKRIAPRTRSLTERNTRKTFAEHA